MTALEPTSAIQGAVPLALAVIVDSRTAVLQALEAVARGQQIALVLPEQIPDHSTLLCVPPRPLRAGSTQAARELIASGHALGELGVIAAAAEIFGVAEWPASIWRHC